MKIFILSFCLNNMIYCFLQHVSYFICAYSLNLHALCFTPCFLCLDLFFHVLFSQIHMFLYLFTCLFVFPTYFMLYNMFSYVLFLFLLYVNVRVTFSYACLMSMVMLCSMCSCAFLHVLCLDPHLHMFICLDSRSSMFMCQPSRIHTRYHAHARSTFFTCLHAQIQVFALLYVQIYIFTRLHARIQVFTCLYVQIYVFTCLCAQIYALLALCHLPCACALHAMFVCLGLDLVCHAMFYCSPFVALSFFLVFWLIGLDLIQTLWSLSLFAHLGLYQRVWITHFGCLCLLASMLYACVSLSGYRLHHV